MKATFVGWVCAASSAFVAGVVLGVFLGRDGHEADSTNAANVARLQALVNERDAEIRDLRERSRSVEVPDLDSSGARVDAASARAEDQDSGPASLSQRVADQAARIEELTRLLDRARNDPIADLRSRFFESDLVRGYSDQERELLFSDVVTPMRRLPKPHQIGPALQAAQRYRAAMVEIRAKFLQEDDVPPSLEELQARAREESAAEQDAWSRWMLDVSVAFRDDADAYADLTQR